MQRTLSLTEMQQLWGSWTSTLAQIYAEPKVSQLLDTKVGRYLLTHPFMAQTLLVFTVLSALPVAVFLGFALLSAVISALGFLLLELLLLLLAAATLLSVLSGVAFFSLLVSSTFSAFHLAVSNVLPQSYPHLTQKIKDLAKQNGWETPKRKEKQ